MSEFPTYPVPNTGNALFLRRVPSELGRLIVGFPKTEWWIVHRATDCGVVYMPTKAGALAIAQYLHGLFRPTDTIWHSNNVDAVGKRFLKVSAALSAKVDETRRRAKQ